MNARTTFEDALIATRFAMEHSSPEALKEYLKEHPGADRSKHHVKKKDEGASSEESLNVSFKKHQQSPEYKTKKDPDYNPQRSPEGMKYPAEVLKSIPGGYRSFVEAMPEKDLESEDEGYNHPAIKKFQKVLADRIKKGERKQVDKEMEDLEDLRDEVSKKRRKAQTDADSDPYRFVGRKLYYAWKAYNAALNHHAKEASVVQDFKRILLAYRVADRFAPHLFKD